ncbi:MAG: urea ABC transporter permease subunit UrtB [Janthinobacterium lividum]
MTRLLAAVLCLAFLATPAQAQPDRTAVLAALCAPDSRDATAALAGLVSDAPASDADTLAWARTATTAYAARQLRCAPDGRATLDLPAGPLDAATLAAAPVPDDARTPVPSLRSRAVLEQLGAVLTLFTARDEPTLSAAAHTLERRADGLPPSLLEAALARDPAAAPTLRALLVAAGLHAPDTDARLRAIAALGQDASTRAEVQLAALRADPAYAADSRIAHALDSALARVRLWLGAGRVLVVLYNGLSVGSVLFMSAAGLVIIFGLMGVINLAQGELITVGAYATFCVQQALRAWAPAWVNWYPLLAIPVAFAATAALGVAIEVLVVRHLYRRPLMTLLATWAISLLLINAIRVLFGSQNLQFLTPPYLTGGVRVVGDFLVTWNHLGAILAAIVAFAATLAVLRLTDLGLFIRAVTQNRAMAEGVGIATRRIDMAAFGLGAGLAGLSGVALSPIYNVNPSMGTGFIIDSFMVVVLGGVGSLAGTALAALGIGLVDVGIEPFYGAVAAKVVSLLLIIAIIQWRPEGLVPPRGRR